MKRVAFLGVLLVGCVHGRYVNVDPIYPPVQQVHQSFYRAPGFKAQGKKVAVLDFKGEHGQGQVFADALAAELFGEGVKVVERQNITKLLDEQRMAQQGTQALTDTQILQKIGQMASVDVVIVGGVVLYDEYIGPRTFSEDNEVQLPFAIPESYQPQETQSTQNDLPPGIIVYRWAPDKYKHPAGVRIDATVYASARGIDVATGEIVWIDTVNVTTAGISHVTGLERLGQAMAQNFNGAFDERVQLYIWNGEAFKFPPNWNEVKGAWEVHQRYVQNPQM